MYVNIPDVPQFTVRDGLTVEEVRRIGEQMGYNQVTTARGTFNAATNTVTFERAVGGEKGC